MERNGQNLQGIVLYGDKMEKPFSHIYLCKTKL
mgnify:CR=1 FL=1